jgi:tetratricopeptide (TPR) repeat protein
MAMNEAAVQGSGNAERVEDAQPTRALWQVPVFFLGVGVLTGIFLCRPLGGDLVSRQVDSELREVRKMLNRPDLDVTQVQKAVTISARTLEHAQAVPDRQGEAHYLHGVAQVRLALLVNDEPQAKELWLGAVEDFKSALNQSVPDSDRGRLNYRRAQAGYYSGEDLAAVANRLQDAAEVADDKAEAYALLVKVYEEQKPPKLKEALAANEKLRLVPPPVSEEVLAAARLQGGELLLRTGWPTRDPNDRHKRVEEACKVLENVRAPGASARVVQEATLLRGQCYMELDRWDEAAALWKKLLDENSPTWPPRGKVLYLQGRCFCKVDPHQFAKAEKAWLECAEGSSAPHAAAADLARAELLVQEQRWDMVVPALQRALKGVSKPTEWTNPLVNLQRLCEQFESTLTMLSRGGAYDIALQVVDVYAPVAQPGRAARLRGDLSAEWAHAYQAASACWLFRQDEAVRALLLQAGNAYKAAADEANPTASAKDPSEALWLAANCLLEAGDAPSTRVVLKRYLEQKEPQPAHAAEAWLRLGDLLGREKLLEDAEQAYRACIACVTASPAFAQRARCRLADILMVSGKVDKAVEILKENYSSAMQGEENVESIEATCFALGNIYFNRRDHGEAQTWLDRVPAQVHNLPAALRAHYQLAESYRQLAIKDAQQIERDKRDLDAAINQGRPDAKTKRESISFQVAQHKTKLIKAEAEYRWVQDNLVRVPTAEQTLSPDEQAQVPFARADCLFYLEKYADAQGVYEELVTFYNRRLKELEIMPAGPNEVRSSEMDRGMARWAAARRRLDAMGGVLRCAAVQGRSERVQQLDGEIRILLKDMDEKVRAEWEAWLKLATDVRAVP